MAAQWSLSQEEEDLHRQRLFRKARKGDEKAKQELQPKNRDRNWVGGTTRPCRPRWARI